MQIIIWCIVIVGVCYFNISSCYALVISDYDYYSARAILCQPITSCVCSCYVTLLWNVFAMRHCAMLFHCMSVLGTIVYVIYCAIYHVSLLLFMLFWHVILFVIEFYACAWSILPPVLKLVVRSTSPILLCYKSSVMADLGCDGLRWVIKIILLCYVLSRNIPLSVRSTT
jgi:hypothetical protein